MNGFLYIDKPINCTSRDVVNSICKIYNIKKVGHTGTLDPLATGVLIIALGEATKLINDITSDDKEYVATALIGLETDSLDITGKVIKEEKPPVIAKEELINILNSFKGTIKQEVPYFSAVRVNGKRLYEYARNNEEVILPTREVEIKDIELLDLSLTEFTFRVSVSKGTYIRSLIKDIAKLLKIPCTMKSLNRIKQGPVSISMCIPLDKVTPSTKLISLSEVLEEYPEYIIESDLLKKVQNGAKIPNPGYIDKVRIYDKDDNFLALYQVDSDSTLLKSYKMFHEVKR